MQGEVALAEIQILIALIMNPTEHWVVNPPGILFDGVHQILDNFIIFHLAFPFCQIGIHIIAGDEVILIIYAVFF